MRLCVFFLCEGRCAEFPHTGLSQRAFPERRDSGNRLTQQTHHYPILCAQRDQIPSHLLSSCSTTTELRQTTGCVNRLASRENCFSLSLCQPGNFVPTRLQRHRASQSRVSRLSARHLAPLRLGLPQRGQLTRLTRVFTSPTRTSPSLFFEWHRHLSGLDHSIKSSILDETGRPSWVDPQTGSDKSFRKKHKTVSHSPADVERLRWAL